jgi:hypothetical protein
MRWPAELMTKAQRERLSAGLPPAAEEAPESIKIANLVRLLVDSPMRVRRLSAEQIGPDDEFLFGLDGDNTGTVLEELFLSAADEGHFSRLSRSVTSAIQEICRKIEDRCTASSIIFAAGDDILFRGRCDAPFLNELQRIYQSITAGLTCSIGYGRTFREVYLALKLAKARPGKNCITGIELI